MPAPGTPDAVRHHDSICRQRGPVRYLDTSCGVGDFKSARVETAARHSGHPPLPARAMRSIGSRTTPLISEIGSAPGELTQRAPGQRIAPFRSDRRGRLQHEAAVAEGGVGDGQAG
jgi:hypothetical protein